MGRTKEYDPDSVIDAAMRAFWKHGFEGTSIRDLAKSCGLTTRSMYNAYPDKDKFFEAALDRYQEKVLNPIIRMIESGRGMASLQAFVSLLGAAANEDGCLFLNTAVSKQFVSKASAVRVEKYLKRLKGAIRAKLEEARSDGDFHGDSDLRSMQLVMAVLGFSLSLKAGLPKQEASSAFLQALADIGSS